MRVHEIGAVLLTSIPDAVALCGAPELAQLPRILVSCNGVIMDGSRVTALVECKHRTPYAPPARDRKELTFLGRRRKPHAAVTVEHYAQTQLQMLVMGVQRCDLISYSVETSTIFRIERNDKWYSLALQHFAHLEQRYLKHGQKPPPDVFFHPEMAGLHQALLQCTIDSMHALAKERTTQVASRFNAANPGPPFLDQLPDSDPRKQASRESTHHISLRMHCP